MQKPILIASNQESNRDALKKTLADSFPLIVVEDSEAVRLALQQKAAPCLALIGTSLEEESEGFFKEVRGLVPKLTIIAVGEDTSDEEAAELVKQGATGYIMFPTDTADLRALADKHCPRA